VPPNKCQAYLSCSCFYGNWVCACIRLHFGLKPINLLLYTTVDTGWQLLITSGKPVVIIQGDAVKAVVWAAILNLVWGPTGSSGPDPSPPLPKRPGLVSRILPSQENSLYFCIRFQLILGSGNYINSRVETAVTRGVHPLMSPLWNVCPISQ
jgi:hypothetical protein